jgi:uncharacterized lipoprotein
MKKDMLMKKCLLTLGILAILAGCGAGPEMQQEMNQGQREDIIDEREDETLNTPGVEMRQEQREDRMDELEDNR